MGCCAGRNDAVLVGETKKPEEEKSGQAGGHEGSLIIMGDRLLKRCGNHELTFYSNLFDESNTDPDLDELKKFVPQYFGTREIDGKKFLILENLLTGYDNPSLLDCKIGKVTWTQHHNERKTKDQMQKAKNTTTGSLGFRISGIEAKDAKGRVTYKVAKEQGFYAITAENIHEEFKKIVGDDRQRVETFIAQTKELLEWFRKQKSKTFFTASVFYVSGKNKCQTKFIDFAHVFDAEGKSDTSNLYSDVIVGLENLIVVWERLLN